MTSDKATTHSAQSYRPGFLLGPLGWLGRDVTAAVAIEPELFSALFELEPYRIHLLGIAIAYGRDRSRSFLSLIRRPPRDVIEQCVGYWPIGLGRLLRALPVAVLSFENYRAIPDLLSDSATAKFLAHRKTIDESLITSLAALPQTLRTPAIFKLFSQVESMERFVPALRFLCGRAGIPYDDLVNELASLAQMDQLVARIAELVE